MGWTHLEDKDVKTRKPHRCMLCECLIPVGDTCRRRTGADDGIHTFYMHEECRLLTLDWDEFDWECLDGAAFRQQLEESREGKHHVQEENSSPQESM